MGSFSTSLYRHLNERYHFFFLAVKTLTFKGQPQHNFLQKTKYTLYVLFNINGKYGVCGVYFKSSAKFISAEPRRLVLNFFFFLQHSLRGIQHIVQSFVTHTRHLLSLFSMLACNLQKLPGLILTNLSSRQDIALTSF